MSPTPNLVYTFVWFLCISIVCHLQCNALNNSTSTDQQHTTTTYFNTHFQTSHAVNQNILKQLQSIDVLLWTVFILCFMICCLCGVFISYCKLQHYFNKELQQHKLILDRKFAASIASLKQVQASSNIATSVPLHPPSQTSGARSRSASQTSRDAIFHTNPPKISTLMRSKSDYTVYRNRVPIPPIPRISRSKSVNDDAEASKPKKKKTFFKSKTFNETVSRKRAVTEPAIVSYHATDVSGQLWQNPIHVSTSNTIPTILPDTSNNINMSTTSSNHLEYSARTDSDRTTTTTQISNRSRAPTHPLPKYGYVQNNMHSQAPILYNQLPLQPIPSDQCQDAYNRPAMQPLQQRMHNHTMIPIPPQVSLPPPPPPMQQNPQHVIINVGVNSRERINMKSENVYTFNHLRPQDAVGSSRSLWTENPAVDGTQVLMVEGVEKNGIVGMMPNMFGNESAMHDSDSDSVSMDSDCHTSL